jgi:hypothetical protein
LRGRGCIEVLQCDPKFTRNWRQHGRIFNTVQVSGPENKHEEKKDSKFVWSCKQILKNSLTATQSPLASKPKYWADLTSHILKYCIICWTSWTGFNCCEWTFLYLDSSFPFLLGNGLQWEMSETKKRVWAPHYIPYSGINRRLNDLILNLAISHNGMNFKAPRLQIHVNFQENFGNVYKSEKMLGEQIK